MSRNPEELFDLKITTKSPFVAKDIEAVDEDAAFSFYKEALSAYNKKGLGSEFCQDGTLYLLKNKGLEVKGVRSDEIDATDTPRDAFCKRGRSILSAEIDEIAKAGLSEIGPIAEGAMKDDLGAREIDIIERTALSLFKSLFGAISDEVGVFVSGEFESYSEDDETWEGLLKKGVVDKYQDAVLIAYSEALRGFCLALYDAVIYSCRNEHGELLPLEERRDEFENIKAAADLKDCSGGAAGQLVVIANNKKAPGSIYNGIERWLSLKLSDYCPDGSSTHWQGWINYIMTGEVGEDEEIFSVTSGVMMPDLNHLMKSCMLNGGGLVLDFLTEEIVKIAKNATEIADIDAKSDEYRKSWNENGRNSMRWEEVFYRKFDEGLKASVYSDIKSIKSSDIFGAIDDFDPTLLFLNPKERVLEEEKKLVLKQEKGFEMAIRKNLRKRKILSGQEAEEKAAQDSVFQDHASMIIALNCYLARNLSIPVWLRDEAAKVFGLTAVSRDDLDGSTKRIEAEIIDFADRRALEVSEKFKCNLRLLRAYNTEKKEYEVKFWRDYEIGADGEYVFELQNVLNAGGAQESISKALDFKSEDEASRYKGRGSIILNGLLFHPKREYLMHAIERSLGKSFHMNHMIFEAVTFGDGAFLMEHHSDIVKFLESYASVGRNPDFNANNIYFLFELLEASEMDARVVNGCLEKLLNLTKPGLFLDFGDDGVVEDTSFFPHLASKDNGADFLKWIREFFGESETVKILLQNRNLIVLALPLYFRESRPLIKELLPIADELVLRGSGSKEYILSLFVHICDKYKEIDGFIAEDIEGLMSLRIKNGDHEAALELAQYYFELEDQRDEFKKRNLEKRFDFTKKAYDLGNRGVRCCESLASMYHKGIGCEIDLEKSLDVYKVFGDYVTAYEKGVDDITLKLQEELTELESCADRDQKLQKIQVAKNKIDAEKAEKDNCGRLIKFVTENICVLEKEIEDSATPKEENVDPQVSGAKRAAEDRPPEEPDAKRARSGSLNVSGAGSLSLQSAGVEVGEDGAEAMQVDPEDVLQKE